MEVPLDQETATADLITDILAPTMAHHPIALAPLAHVGHWEMSESEVCELVHTLVSGTGAWKNAWSVGPDPTEVSD
ncbi:MAG TPA: hypothetical protein VFZ97_20065 [Acidimicrobiales bacterium]